MTLFPENSRRRFGERVELIQLDLEPDCEINIRDSGFILNPGRIDACV